VQALQLGTGPDLVLIHGAGANINDFTLGLAQDLAQSYRVTLFDRPGHGASPAAPGSDSPMAQALQLAQAAQSLGLVSPLVLGHSYGASVALAWALLARGLLGQARPALAPAALVLVSGVLMPARLGLRPLTLLAATRLGRAIIAPLSAAWTADFMQRAVLDAIFSPQAVPALYAQQMGASLALRRASLAANALQIAHLRPCLRQMAPAYPVLGLPVEIVHGTADLVVPHEAHAQAAARLLPNAHVTLLPGIGHMPHHTDPQAIVAAVQRASALVMAD